MAVSPDLYEQREALRKEQAALLTRLDLAATNITRNRVRLHTETMDPFTQQNVEAAHELAERDAAGLQSDLESSFRRSDSVERKIAAAEVGDATARESIQLKEQEDRTLNQTEKLDRALGDAQHLRKESQDHRVDRTYTNAVLETAERQVVQAEEQIRRSLSR